MLIVKAPLFAPIIKLVVEVNESNDVVFIPPVKVSNAVAVSGTVFCKYNKFACYFVRFPVDDDDGKNDGL